MAEVALTAVQRNNRIVYIDIAKAICIVLVVMGHYMPDVCPLWWTDTHNVIYTFHMPLFMFASGFVYIATKKSISYKDFIYKKVRRLMIPYFVVSFLIVSLKLLSQGYAYVQNPVTAYSYLKVFYLPEAGYFLWFIWALWWMFVIIPFFRTKTSRVVLLGIAIALHYVPFSITQTFCLDQFRTMLVFFMLGVVVYDFKAYFSFLRKIPAVAYFALFVVSEPITMLTNANGGGIGLRLVC